MVECQVSTNDFWREMTREGFVRLSRNTGANRGTLFVVEVPPESVPGFYERLFDNLDEALTPKPIEWPWRRWAAHRAMKRAVRRASSHK